MKDIYLEPEILESAPFYGGYMLECSVVNSSYNPGLWEEIEEVVKWVRATLLIEQVNQRSGISQMRRLYKKLGKDPNRYRPSAEALTRRILQGKSLYRINTLVDLINLVSLKTGLSIGGFDASKVKGNLSFGVGKKGEQFEGIGRGLLNVEGLPIYRDEDGGIGSPTSDEERTKLSGDTTRLLMVIHSASGSQDELQIALSMAERLLVEYAGATDIEIRRF
jgi:DNA/RNA-binding domain of Phe-tRNA-synthetase-like protein